MANKRASCANRPIVSYCLHMSPIVSYCLLCVPASCELVFSADRITVSQRRADLHLDTVKNIPFIHSNI